MRLRTKFMLMVGVGFAITLVLTLLVARYVVTDRFADLESDSTEENTQRAVSALYQDFTALNVTFGPEIFECGSFRWVQDVEGTHLEVNFDGPSFAILNINYVAFVMNPGDPPSGVGYDPETGETLPFPRGFAEELMREGNPIVTSDDNNTAFTGIVILPDDALLIQSFPIAVDTLYGPVKGRTIFARLLDDAEVARLGEQTHMSLELVRWDDPDMPADFLAVQSQLSDETPVVSRELDSNTVCGYGLLDDVSGQPALIIKATMPRDIYYQGQQTVYWLIALLAAISVSFTLGLALVMNRLVLSRLLGLGRDINKVRETGDLTALLASVGQTVELSLLRLASPDLLLSGALPPPTAIAVPAAVVSASTPATPRSEPAPTTPTPTQDAPGSPPSSGHEPAPVPGSVHDANASAPTAGPAAVARVRDAPDAATDWLRAQGGGGDVLLALVDRVRADGEAGKRLHRLVNGQILVRHPEGFADLGIDEPLAALLAAGLLETDRLAPMRNVRELEGQRGTVLSAAASRALDRLLGAAPARTAAITPPAPVAKTPSPPTAAARGSSAANPPEASPDAMAVARSLVREVRERSPSTVLPVREEGGWLEISAEFVRNLAAARGVSHAALLRSLANLADCRVQGNEAVRIRAARDHPRAGP